MILTDLYPNSNAYRHLKQSGRYTIEYAEFPVDATNVPNALNGFRTVFSGIHHFRPDMVRKLLKNAADARAGIAIFDGGDKSLLAILGILLLHPIAFLLFTPFFRPFRISRLFFTYFVPLIPLYTIWDGCVSILRLYTPAELQKLAEEIEAPAYTWKSGRVKNKLGMHVTYLIGYPVQGQ